VDEHQVEKRPAVEVVLTTLHAGGKFGGEGYAVSGGLHGVGLSVVNALSKTLLVEIRRDGRVWTQRYEGSRPAEPLQQGSPTTETGTTVTFWADPDIFETVDYSFETLTTRLREMAFLNRNLEIIVRDERPDAEEIPEGTEETPSGPVERRFRYAAGIVDYVAHLNTSKEPAHRSVISYETEDKAARMSLEVAMQWNTGFTESVHTFANTINTHEGGTHEEGFRAALTSQVNRFAREWGVLKEKDVNLSGDDVREGLTAIVSMKMGEPQFEGQTKTKLGNTEAKSFVQKVVNERLGEWFEKNPTEGKDIARKAQSASFARLAARKARDAARSRKGLMGGAGLPGKLADCQSTSPEECELFIVEGDSAGGPAKQGRDARIQAILPIRGKILNVEKARIDRILNNQEVQAIISALGTGIHEDFDINRLRYHKVVLMADADVDGQHIQTLLLTLLFRFMRPVIEFGYVYLAQPPLFQIKWSGRGVAPEYAYSDREKSALIETGKAAGKRLKAEDVQRYKGLGEMNTDQLWDTTMDPDQRLLLQVTLEDAAQADEMFTTLMGEDVVSRRQFIQRNARDVRFLDI
jgi:DNA gyrase subunit B